MKKMFFYANFRTYDNTLGITRKVFSQIETFKKLGYDVTYSGYLVDGVAIFDGDGNVIEKILYPVDDERIQHIIRRSMIMKLCINFMKKNDVSYEFAYCRYHFFDHVYLKMLQALKVCCKKVVIEAHSAPKFPKKPSLMWYVALKDLIFSKKAHKCVDLVASMSDESSLWNIRTIKITNAVDLTQIPLRSERTDDGEINLISVSFEREVHGYDRLIRGMYNYYKAGGQRNLHFHIVGTVLPSTEKLIKSLQFEDRCTQYGPLAGHDLDLVYDKADMAVGCLANHRIGSTFGSALKTKEYIAKGIPFVYGWNEKILENFPYALKIELCEKPIDMNEVIQFYDGLNKEGMSEKIRGYLGKEDKWEYQMKKVIDALQ